MKRENSIKTIYIFFDIFIVFYRYIRTDEFNITGPVGNFFKPIPDSKVALVVGGIGLAPMINTAKIFKSQNIHVTLLYGGRCEEDILLRDMLNEICDEVIIATKDGSVGRKGKNQLY